MSTQTSSGSVLIAGTISMKSCAKPIKTKISIFRHLSADPLPLFSWPGRDEIGDDTVLHILSICIFLTIGPFSLAFDCAIDFPSMAENEWGVRRRPQIT